MAFRLGSQEKRFYAYFEEMADGIYDAAKIVQACIRGDAQSGSNMDKIQKISQRAEHLQLLVLKQVGKCLVTPFDREDILEITHNLLDITYHLEDALELAAAHIPANRKHKEIIEIASLSVQASRELKDAVLKLAEIRAQQGLIWKNCEKVIMCKRRADIEHIKMVARFLRDTPRLAENLRCKEVINHLLGIMGCYQRAAEFLLRISVKYV